VSTEWLSIGCALAIAGIARAQTARARTTCLALRLGRDLVVVVVVVCVLIVGLLRVVASNLVSDEMRLGAGSARSLRHRGIRSVHTHETIENSPRERVNASAGGVPSRRAGDSRKRARTLRGRAGIKSGINLSASGRNPDLLKPLGHATE
jgi:hypothetical protein